MAWLLSKGGLDGGGTKGSGRWPRIRGRWEKLTESPQVFLSRLLLEREKAFPAFNSDVV